MKNYKITLGTGTMYTHEEIIEVEDWEDEGNAIDNLVDKLENENQMGFFITEEGIHENGYGDDEYCTAGNHGLNLLHYGILYVEEIENGN